MKSLALICSSLLLFLGGVAALASLNANPQPVASSALDPAVIERGRYLVHQVGMCIDCHSPRGPDGAFLEGKHLTGAPLPFVATVPMPWAPVAPPLAGLPAHFDRASMAKFLMTGERPQGMPPTLPPMPPFRFDEPDATAVAVYLESLGKPLTTASSY